jgi:hypothetical protein
MHREMLNDFTSVVKRVFGTKMSMVSIMRDEIEMIGMRGEKVGRRGALSSRIESDHEGLIFKHFFFPEIRFFPFLLSRLPLHIYSEYDTTETTSSRPIYNVPAKIRSALVSSTRPRPNLSPTETSIRPNKRFAR